MNFYRLQSLLLDALTLKRNLQVKSYPHAASRYMIDSLVAEGI
ncbi:hypothetical protein [Kamptonema formosum]|nr:hypothetical protein [Oscillatoria sp. PCC 10802]